MKKYDAIDKTFADAKNTAGKAWKQWLGYARKDHDGYSIQRVIEWRNRTWFWMGIIAMPE